MDQIDGENILLHYSANTLQVYFVVESKDWAAKLNGHVLGSIMQKALKERDLVKLVIIRPVHFESNNDTNLFIGLNAKEGKFSYVKGLSDEKTVMSLFKIKRSLRIPKQEKQRFLWKIGKFFLSITIIQRELCFWFMAYTCHLNELHLIVQALLIKPFHEDYAAAFKVTESYPRNVAVKGTQKC
jgi:hypothetical protein